MAEFSSTGKILQEYNQNSYSRRNSDDVDFSDVFGGPPRRTSGQDNDRRSSDFQGPVEEGEGGSSPWFTLREKPVFGDGGLEQRRRYPSNDFFDDVFRGGDEQPSLSCSQSARVTPRRNAFSSAPHSRPMSPSRSLPPFEPLTIPEIFSLPDCSKNTYIVTATSVNQNSFNPSPSRFKRSLKYQDGDARVSHESIDLAHQVPSDDKEFTRLKEVDEKAQAKGYVDILKSSACDVDIHFSMYNWVSNGVPVVFSMSNKHSKLRERVKIEKRYYGDAEGENNDIDIMVSTKPKMEKSSAEPVSITIKDVLESPRKTQISESTPLRSFFKGSKKGDVTSTFSKRQKETKVEVIKKLYPNDDVSIHWLRSDLLEPCENVKVNLGIAGRTKDCVENFSRDSQYGIPIKTISDIRIVKNDTEASYENWDEAWLDISEVVDQEDSIKTGRQHLESIDDLVNSSTNINTKVVSEEVLQDITLTSRDANDEEKEGYENKVSEWSKGKEQNIRALLSTLQFVLWKNSGWKPIPLVEIIEANAVKRAYQKALLCLHPDKLQQKGATSCHKFVAEKVFDILQEAWDHFNSLGHL